MKRIILIVAVFGGLALLCGCAAKNVQPAGADVEAARAALNNARNQGADRLCPDEFQSAEFKLRQAELLLQDEENLQANQIAQQSINLSALAEKCAEARRAYGPQETEQSGPPAELKDFKETVYFDYNSNVIKPSERAKLDRTVAFLGERAGKYRFFVLISAYCDPPGDHEENLELSQRRALVVRYYLTEKGLPAGRMFMKALGKAPAMRETTGAEKSYRKQIPEWRRVEITVMFAPPTEGVVKPNIAFQ